MPVERSLARCETPGFARAMLGFERAAPGVVRASALGGCKAARLPFALAGARLRSCACDIPPPVRYVGCVRDASLEVPGCAACDCPGCAACGCPCRGWCVWPCVCPGGTWARVLRPLDRSFACVLSPIGGRAAVPRPRDACVSPPPVAGGGVDVGGCVEVGGR